MLEREQPIGAPPSQRGRACRGAPAGLGALAAVCLAIAAGLLYQATPEVRTVDPDSIAPLVQKFEIRNPSPLLAMGDVHWSCILRHAGTRGGLTFPGLQTRVEIVPLASRTAQCTTMGIESKNPMVVRLTVRFRTLFFERVVTAQPFYWQTSGGRGKWLAPDSIPALPVQADDRAVHIKP